MKRHYSDSNVLPLNMRRGNNCDPRRLEDLVVNRNRIKELSDWIDFASKTPRVSLLLLNGPPGCGKAACVRVLAAQKDIEIAEWTTPVDSYEYLDDDNFPKPVSVASKFKRFLLGVGRYSSVFESKNLPSSHKRLIVVKDFPTSFLTSPEQFTEIVDFYTTRGRIPVIFICTDSVKKKSKDIAYELFHEDFKQKHHISQLTFIAIPVTSIIKALKRVVQLQHLSVNEELIRDIAIESRGDIRKAINDVKIMSVKTLKSTKSTNVNKKLKSQGQKKVNLKDVDKEITSLFHCVGRVLYAKRENPNDDKKNVSHTNVRGNLVHKPLEIAEEFCHYSNQFLSLAHSNYFDIFSSIDCIAKAAEFMSDSDIIMSEWREKELLSTVGFSVAVCGLMESNNDPIRKWKPLKGSQWNDDLRIAVANRLTVENLLSDYSVSKSDIIIDVVPSMIQMWRSSNSELSNIKWCPYGFLPHRTEELASVIRKVKSEVLTVSPYNVDSNKYDSDSPVHISDDSD